MTVSIERVHQLVLKSLEAKNISRISILKASSNPSLPPVLSCTASTGLRKPHASALTTPSAALASSPTDDFDVPLALTTIGIDIRTGIP